MQIYASWGGEGGEKHPWSLPFSSLCQALSGEGPCLVPDTSATLIRRFRSPLVGGTGFTEPIHSSAWSLSVPPLALRTRWPCAVLMSKPKSSTLPNPVGRPHPYVPIAPAPIPVFVRTSITPCLASPPPLPSILLKEGDGEAILHHRDGGRELGVPGTACVALYIVCICVCPSCRC